MSIDIKQLLQNKQVVQGVFFGVLIIAGLGYFYSAKLIAPLNKDLASLTKEVKDKEAKARKLENLVRRPEILEKKLRELESRLREESAKLPDNKGLDQVIRIITDELEKHGLEMISFTPKGETKKPFHIEMAFGVSVRAAFGDLARFIAEIGRKQRLMHVKNVNLTGGGQTTQTGEAPKLNISMNVLTYFAKK